MNIARLRPLMEHEAARDAERRKADRTRLRKLKRAGDWEAVAREYSLQLEEYRERNGYGKQIAKVQHEAEALQREVSTARSELFMATLEVRRLRAENRKLREALGERDGDKAIKLSDGAHTPKTISRTLEVLGYRAGVRAVQNWLRKWYAETDRDIPTRWRFGNDPFDETLDTLNHFMDWCQKTRKLHKKP